MSIYFSYRRCQLPSILNCLILLASCLILTVGCSKDYVRTDVEGFWRITRIVYHADGSEALPTNLFYSIVPAIIQTQTDGKTLAPLILGRMEYTPEGYLRYFNIYLRHSQGGVIDTGDTGNRPNQQQLYLFGLNNYESTTFTISHPASGQMVLRSSFASIFLQRF